MADSKVTPETVASIVAKAMDAKHGISPPSTGPRSDCQNILVQVMDIEWPSPKDSSWEQALFPGKPAAVYALVMKPAIHGAQPKAMLRIVWHGDPDKALELMRFVILRPMQGMSTPHNHPMPEHVGTLGNPFNGDPISIFRDRTLNPNASDADDDAGS